MINRVYVARSRHFILSHLLSFLFDNKEMEISRFILCCTLMKLQIWTIWQLSGEYKFISLLFFLKHFSEYLSFVFWYVQNTLIFRLLLLFLFICFVKFLVSCGTSYLGCSIIYWWFHPPNKMWLCAGHLCHRNTGKHHEQVSYGNISPKWFAEISNSVNSELPFHLTFLFFFFLNCNLSSVNLAVQMVSQYSSVGENSPQKWRMFVTCQQVT